MIHKVGVIGAGTMGSGIAQICLQHGFSVKLYDTYPQALDSGHKKIKEGLAYVVSRGKFTELQAKEALSYFKCVDKLDALVDVDLIIEAASESLAVKQEIFQKLGAFLPENKILATNTSSLPVQKVAEKTRYPARVLGMHFFNPAPVMKLIEMIRTPQTDETYFKAAWEFALALEKTPVEVKDTPGFIVNRVLRPFYVSALRLVEEGCAGISGVDKAAKEVGGCPMGPFELMDFIGLDVNLAITKVIFEALGKPKRLEPSKLQEDLVGRGCLGRKTKKGFYIYQAGQTVKENSEAPVRRGGATVTLWSLESIWSHIEKAIIEEAQIAHQEGVATKEGIDTAVRLGARFPQGPFELQAARGY